jgi:hypothetical protein
MINGNSQKYMGRLTIKGAISHVTNIFRSF